MASKKRNTDKGGEAEEALRSYFMESGYFVVRGVPVTHDDLDITDVDLWLYLRASALHRHRANVDAKNKASPKAAERILWALGLQKALGLDEAIVATTSKNATIRSFGELHAVRVLDGTLMANLVKRFADDDTRLSEEELLYLLDEEGMDKLQGNWTQRIRTARGRLLGSLSFSGCNAWLTDAAFFLDAFGAGQRRESALRCTYLSVSYFLIGLDFELARLAFLPQDTRRAQLHAGFAYGDGGRERADQLLALLHEARPDVYRELRAELDTPDDARPDVLADFFARNDIGGKVFPLARRFEAAAYNRSLALPGELELEQKAVLGVILDAHQIDRGAVLGANGTT